MSGFGAHLWWLSEWAAFYWSLALWSLGAWCHYGERGVLGGLGLTCDFMHYFISSIGKHSYVSKYNSSGHT
ncbi:uncharacterized protein K441DRAFT_658556 [Cenococcum geophilum 1.58]|uniref:uncharacterized protein n=1 Tax=Cenococcum geophilum 1.58 TaxID=794803 RepID=UPI00358FE9FD|nr:hypothetical protein K441DRAFT_658556 [Cenococcum geophilum 1.58]